MTKQTVRQLIRCWKCKEVFTLLIDTAGDPQLSKTCPFCGAPIHINLADYPTTVIRVMRIEVSDTPQEISVFELPEMIETKEPDTL